MSVYLPRNAVTWYYDFWIDGRRYLASTHRQNRVDALQVERVVRQQLQTLLPPTVRREETPTFHEWAQTFLRSHRRITRYDLLKSTVANCLDFWGRSTIRPSAAVPRRTRQLAPCHDLRLADPILEPDWLDRFAAWMRLRGLSEATQQSYRSACRQMYALALEPRWRTRTRIDRNPFRDWH